MKPGKFLLAFSLLIFAAFASNAQTANKPDDVKIVHGVKNGELTKKETRTLVHQQKKIHHERREARADGVVTPQERKNLAVEKKRADASIYRKKHNARDRN